jgi:hypothetical protein
MRRIRFCSSLVLIVLALSRVPMRGAAQQVASPAPAVPAIGLEDPASAWACVEVGAGVNWCSQRFAALFGAPESLSVMRVDAGRPGVRIRFAEAAHFSDPTPRLRLERTSDIAARTRAVAAVNGDFFDGFTHQGPLVIDGLVRSFAPKGHAQAKATFGIDDNEQPRFWSKGPEGWLIPSGIAHAVSGGPMLIENGVAAEFPPGDAFASTRHPRTAVCVAANRTVYLVVADGRTRQAAGLSLPELAAVMRAVGCTTAMNLDGGGSSTMWVRGEPLSGVVNHPSDRSGERAVGAAVVVIAPDVIVGDTGEATLTPETAWSSSRREGGFIGPDFAEARAPGGAQARWELPVYFSGAYKVFFHHLAAGGSSQVAIDLGKRTVPIDLTSRTRGWVEVGEIEVTVSQGLIPAPALVPIAVRSGSGSTGPLVVDAIKLEEVVR